MWMAASSSMKDIPSSGGQICDSESGVVAGVFIAGGDRRVGLGRGGVVASCVGTMLLVGVSVSVSATVRSMPEELQETSKTAKPKVGKRKRV